ncbi:MAG: GntR family transcriptional regulator [Desulfobacterales bacterium]|nr:GntR family transcriptional regulator [Deltaproteobacteria bacterium]NNK93214.1 GntR family transcriptional regulator [Desulfobacterales bacterium]
MSREPEANIDKTNNINRLNLSEQIANSLRDMIVQNQLPPGDRIREREICQKLEVSRTPLREALHKLASEGLVDLVPNCGAVVTAPDAEEIADMLQVLGVLEAFAGERACELVTEEEINEIKALQYEMLAAFSRGDRLAYFKLNQRIHLSIIKAARSETLLSLHTRLNARLYRIRYQSNLRNELWGSAVKEHDAIMAALENRAASELSTLLRQHFRSTWEKVSELMEEDDHSSAAL